MEQKFQNGDIVRCTNPTHPGANPFAVHHSKKVPTIPGLCYYDGTRRGRWHDFGWSGCRESELELVEKVQAK